MKYTINGAAGRGGVLAVPLVAAGLLIGAPVAVAADASAPGVSPLPTGKLSSPPIAKMSPVFEDSMSPPIAKMSPVFEDSMSPIAKMSPAVDCGDSSLAECTDSTAPDQAGQDPASNGDGTAAPASNQKP